MAHARNLIAGEWRDGHAVGESLDPATGEVLGTFADAGAVTARAAIDAARTAFTATPWARDRELRARALLRLADRMTERRDDLVATLSRENGKKRADAAMEIDATIPKLRYNAALALTDAGRAGEFRPGAYSMSLHQPLGVAAVIVPWNSPVILAVRSFAPALAAGCTVAMKMPAQTALTNGLLYELVRECLPPGVLNAFTESGNDGAPLLVSDPGTDVVSYTGSTAVGRVIMAGAAARLKPVSLELGGKSPMLVFDDADLDAAVPVLTAAVTTFAGQFCMAGSRILAQRGIAGELRARLTAALEAVRVGPGDDPATDMGPVIDRAQALRIDGLVAGADGTVLVRGGLVHPGPDARDALLRPALVEVADVAAPIVQREVFGPVATFEVFADESEAVARANATEYGLAASVWTRDVDRPLRVARELDAGTVWTNTWGVIHDQMEEGGFKQSGVGRLNGPRALAEFHEIKHIVLRG
ncbi:Succinate-semialdehyde dehydrogenase [NADP(+)] GabD [Actinomadura rubteroloni]|uniref:Succinate-semialdehyde dehydrogenase [NADP(+)] GabD n=1 Tax=Actinomadura rubteroloni TaxID=1926885 RepID=A0A2P4US35_9ACTN|nr:aldehyde dehydrogenase family protein [Actinomadura rubteroloni]POM27863.1 Succinate-semialdehyde dehydrogenase [NADP(+)] GabD [Actinomadura rubteroloni]